MTNSNLGARVRWIKHAALACVAAIMHGSLQAAQGTAALPPIATCSPASPADFVDATAAPLRRVLPVHCAPASDNPVSFVWPPPPGGPASRPWRLEVRQLGGPTVAQMAGLRPRVTLDKALPTGSYEWQVSYQLTDGLPLRSSWRKFSIDPDLTLHHDLPSSDVLIERLARQPADRLLPPGLNWKQAARALNQGATAPMFKALLQRAERSLTASPPPNIDAGTAEGVSTEARKAVASLGLMQTSNQELEHVEVLAFAWRLTGDDRFLDAARARVMQLAAWRPDGASSEQRQPQANRNIYLAMAWAVELLGPALTSDEWRVIATVFGKRIQSAVAATDLLDQEPYRSFENSTIHIATQALALVVGRAGFDSAGDMLRKVWPLYVAQPQAWGDGDGGNGASIAYAWYDLRLVARAAAVLALSADVDVMQLGQLRRIGDFLIATTTPSKQHGNAFGDGAEVPYLFSAFGPDDFRLYADLTRKPTDAWYWRQVATGAEAQPFIHPLHLLLALRTQPAVQPRAPARNDWLFALSGIVAMHSDIGSRLRSSVYFRSGPYGAFNHAHADQNSFVLQHGGSDLLISSGYYPYYQSPHHAQVARATRYKNAVTFDGGIGQAEPAANPTTPGAPVNAMEPSGKLVFSHAEPGLAIASGDATAAYRGWDAQAKRWRPFVSEAIRSVAYFKQQGVVVVHDWLRSDKARRWEWNYHGLEPFARSAQTLEARNGSKKACISHHGTDGQIDLIDRFDVPPEGAKVAAQYHARYTAHAASKSTSMVTVIRLDCESIPITVDEPDAEGGSVVTVGSRRVLFRRDGNALVQQPVASPAKGASR